MTELLRIEWPDGKPIPDELVLSMGIALASYDDWEKNMVVTEELRPRKIRFTIEGPATLAEPLINAAYAKYRELHG